MRPSLPRNDPRQYDELAGEWWRPGGAFEILHWLAEAPGEILEHVTDLPGTVAELCRVLRPGGLLILDTVNDTALGRFVTVTLGERFKSVPKGIHDPELFVDPAALTAECARHGVRLRVRGLRPSLRGLLRWLVLPTSTTDGSAAGRPLGRMVPVRSTAVLYQGMGYKEGKPDEC
jgi:2-polyprenyl-6-hydroxyphenyl methylase/3-demethylubiquinone-9 3-methyltransferase